MAQLFGDFFWDGGEVHIKIEYLLVLINKFPTGFFNWCDIEGFNLY